MADYHSFLRDAGVALFEVDSVVWQKYQGVLIPAYLPHCIPPEISATARDAIRLSSVPLVRWTSAFDYTPGGAPDWWFVIRDGDYDATYLSANTRSKLRRGQKRLDVRRVSPKEILECGYAICQLASNSYGTSEFLPGPEEFSRRVAAAQAHPESVEYFAVFRGADMLAFSENHIQKNAVFMDTIWYAPDGLKDYASYVLMDAILTDYLTVRNFAFVSDGSRSIYHETGVHDFLISKFGFRKAHSKMHVRYAQWLRVLLPVIIGAGRLTNRLPPRFRGRAIRRVEALARQEQFSVKEP